MEDSYISNIDENNDLEMEIYEKYDLLKIDYEKLNNDMNDLKKENLKQKHQIQYLQIENEELTQTKKNQEGLIKFYKQYRSEHEESSMEKKFAELEEQIKENAQNQRDSDVKEMLELEQKARRFK